MINKEQLIVTFATLGGEPLLPPSIGASARMTHQDLERDYPERFQIYQAIKDPYRVLTPDELIQLNRMRGRLRMANNLDRYVSSHYSGDRRVLRERQMAVFDDIRIGVEQGVREGVIEAPTGFGKTVIFGELIAATDVPTLVVVPRQRLVEQTYRSFKRFNPDMSVGRVYGRRKEVGHQVTITTYQSLAADIETQRVSIDGVLLLILDEVDEATSFKRVEAIEKFQDAQIIGLSATPERIEDQVEQETRVVKMMQNEIHSVSLREAVEEGYISSFSSYIVEVDVDISNVQLTESGNYNEKEIDMAINTQAQNEAAVKFFLEVREYDQLQQARRGQLVLQPLTTSVYVTSVSHAQKLARMFRENGVNAAAVWGGQNTKEQDEILRKWNTGEIEVVCSKDLLVRGNDIPKIRFVENVAPTSSYKVEKQRCGRGLRLDEDNPDKHTIIADFVYKNTNRRNRQVLFSEIAEGAVYFGKRALSKDLDGIDLMPRDPVHNVPSPTIQVVGLRVITDPTEVMTLTRKMISEHEAYNGLHPLVVSSIARDYSVGVSTVNKRLKELAEIYPDKLIKPKERTNPYLVTDDGEKLLRDLFKPTTYHPVTARSLANEYTVGYAKVTRTLRRLANLYPDDIKVGGGGHPYMFTDAGERLAKYALGGKNPVEDLSKPSEPSTFRELAKEYSVSVTTVSRRLTRLAEAYPEEFKSQSRNRPYIITSEGKRLLTESFANSHIDVVPSSGEYHSPSVGDLAQEYGVNIATVSRRLRKLAEAYPNEFQSQGYNRPYLVTNEGERLLKGSFDINQAGSLQPS